MSWAWGSVLCRRCDRGAVVVVEEGDGVARLGGIECPRCGAHNSAFFVWRGGACDTEALALRRARAWQAEAIADTEPPTTPPRAS